MGLLKKLNPFRDEEADEKEARKMGGQHPADAAPRASSKGDSGPECAVCNQPDADKKFGGQMFHKKCLRKTRKAARSMV